MARILLVEDEENMADFVSRFLSRRGFEVEVAYDLPEGMSKFNKEHEIVLLDINLKGETSFPLLKKIKEESPETMVIMVSANDTDDSITEAKKLGADGFIPKPFMSEYLERMLLSKINLLKKDLKSKGEEEGEQEEEGDTNS